MKKIYRPNQIGGCITEISTATTKILIDMGRELEKSKKELPITEVLENCNAVFFTHYHGDHMGLYNRIPLNNPMYIGATAKQIFSVLVGRVEREIIPLMDRFNTFTSLEKSELAT